MDGSFLSCQAYYTGKKLICQTPFSTPIFGKSGLLHHLLPHPGAAAVQSSHHDEVSKAALKPNRDLLRIHVVVEGINPHVLVDEAGEEVDGVASWLIHGVDVAYHCLLVPSPPAGHVNGDEDGGNAVLDDLHSLVDQPRPEVEGVAWGLVQYLDGTGDGYPLARHEVVEYVVPLDHWLQFVVLAQGPAERVGLAGVFFEVQAEAPGSVRLIPLQGAEVLTAGVGGSWLRTGGANGGVAVVLHRGGEIQRPLQRDGEGGEISSQALVGGILHFGLDDVGPRHPAVLDGQGALLLHPLAHQVLGDGRHGVGAVGWRDGSQINAPLVVVLVQAHLSRFDPLRYRLRDEKFLPRLVEQVDSHGGRFGEEVVDGHVVVNAVAVGTENLGGDGEALQLGEGGVSVNDGQAPLCLLGVAAVVGGLDDPGVLPVGHHAPLDGAAFVYIHHPAEEGPVGLVLS